MKFILAFLFVLLSVLFFPFQAESGETVQLYRADNGTFIRLYQEECQNHYAPNLIEMYGWTQHYDMTHLKKMDGRFVVLLGDEPPSFKMYSGCWSQDMQSPDGYAVMFEDGEGGPMAKDKFKPVDNATIKIDPNEVPPTMPKKINI